MLNRAGSVLAHFIKASWTSPARLGTILAHFGHVYTATTNRAEPCWYCAGTVSSGSLNAVFVKRKKDNLAIIAVYVNGLIIVTQDEEMMREIKKSLTTRFKMKDLVKIS